MDTKLTREKIKDGDTVVFRKLYEPDDFRMVKVTKEETYNVFGTKVSLEHLVGLDFGSVVEIDRANKLPRVVSLTDDHFNQLFQLHNVDLPSENLCRDEAMDTSESVQQSASTETGSSNSMSSARDNRHLKDDQTAQKLSADQIELLKSSSSDANEIVDQLVANSDTFSSKTVFAQAKYIKKKKEKYVLLIQLVQPTIRLITQYFLATSSFKSLSLRIDSVSQILSSLNVKAFGRYLIIDTSIGLLTAALLDRLLGKPSPHGNSASFGKVIQSYIEAGPNASWREAVDLLNCDANLLRSCLLSLPFSQLVQVMKSRISKTKVQVNEPIDSSGNGDSSVVDSCPHSATDQVDSSPKCKSGFKRHAEDKVHDEADQEKWREKKKKKLERKNIRKIEETEAINILTEGHVDGFILVYRGQSLYPIARVLLQFTRPSMPFVIFSPTINPLEEAAIRLKDLCVNLSIHESWMRKYQVLPERTRPEVSMSGSSGYILTGTKLLSP